MGPYEVLERSDKYFTLQVGSRQDRVSIDRLKVALVDKDQPVQVAQPPKRGRPPTKNLSHSAQGFSESKDSKRLKTQQQSSDGPQIVQSPFSARPTYAEITTRSGRATKAPDKYTY